MDTRKTPPGLRHIMKYAVRCGGGVNHRMDLSEMVLIKDNQLQACQPHSAIGNAVRLVRKKTKKLIEVEVDFMHQYKDALIAKPDIILLDNMTCAQIRQAVRLKKKMGFKKKPLLEASGGIGPHNIRCYCKTGVDRISMGSLTHTVKAIDLGLDMIQE
jgi:nicotinate-nucleotide pyrophosphorylase (carboxylating)